MQTLFILLLILVVIIMICYRINGAAEKAKTKSKAKTSVKSTDQVVNEADGKECSFYTGDAWFAEIAKGTKTIDARPRGEEFFKSLVGKSIKYVHGDKSIRVKVTKVVHYNSIAEMLDKEDWKKIGPQYKSKDELVNILHTYFTEKVITEIGGINAIYLDLNVKGAEIATIKFSVKKGRKEKIKRATKKKRKFGGDPWFEKDLTDGTTGDEISGSCDCKCDQCVNGEHCGNCN